MSTCYFENNLLLSPGEIAISQNYTTKGLLAHTQIGTETNRLYNTKACSSCGLPMEKSRLQGTSTSSTSFSKRYPKTAKAMSTVISVNAVKLLPTQESLSKLSGLFCAGSESKWLQQLILILKSKNLCFSIRPSRWYLNTVDAFPVCCWPIYFPFISISEVFQ